MTQKEFRVWTLGTGGVVVAALALFAVFVLNSVAVAQTKNVEVANAAVAKVEAKAKEIDAGVGEQLARVEKRLTDKIDKQDKKLDRMDTFQRCQLDKKWCPAARELLSGDDDP